MKKAHFAFLKTNRACESGLEWAETQSDLYELWNNCHRGDWLLWLANKLKVDQKKLALCAALCAHTVVHLMTDRRSREAVRIAFLWGRGKATDEQLREAREAAWAAWAVADAAAAWAANAYAADAWAIAATVAARAVAWAAADDAAYAADDADARQANALRTAEIARKILTQEVFEKIATL